MSAATNYLELAVLGHAFGGSAFTQPTAWFVKLHIGDPGEDATANPAAETTRQAVTAWNAPAAGSVSATNTPVASWLSVAATETYSHISVWDASTLGNPLARGALSTPRAVTAGGDFVLDALTITLD